MGFKVISGCWISKLVRNKILAKNCETCRLGVTFNAESKNDINFLLQANFDPEMLIGRSESRSRSTCCQEWVPFLQSALKVALRRYVSQTFVKKFLTNWSTYKSLITLNLHIRATPKATKMSLKINKYHTIFIDLRFVAFQLDHWLAYSR